MSSRVWLSGDPGTVSQVVWRQVGAAEIGQPAGEAPPDAAACAAQLEMQYEQRVREAQTEGVREGEIAGRNRAAADLQPVVERLTRAIEEIASMRARLRQEAESDVVQLALAIARRVIRREVAADPDALRGLVMAASCLEQSVGGGLVEVLSDPSCEVGSVVFETTRGNLDGSVDSQLQEIERGLTDRLRKQS
jgi:flagellar assembly protein FliH